MRKSPENEAKTLAKRKTDSYNVLMTYGAPALKYAQHDDDAWPAEAAKPEPDAPLLTEIAEVTDRKFRDVVAWEVHEALSKGYPVTGRNESGELGVILPGGRWLSEDEARAEGFFDQLDIER